MKKLSNGSEKLQSKEMQKRKLTWEICMQKGKVFNNLMKKLPNGMGEVYFNLMKTLSNGTGKQQNKVVHMRSVYWDLCLKKEKACLGQMMKLSNGTEKQQNKEMLMHN
uniref:Uncharacterized protein n=1 Tax=Plectus sambesii TaxID=2011161 RepID=A0A914V699_9BILA